MDPETQPRPQGAEFAPPGPRRRPGPLRLLCREEKEAWRRHYRRHFKTAARALGLGFVAGFAYFMLWPAREKKALEFVVQSLKDIPLESSPLVLALTLFYHNTRASIVAVGAGAVPFLFLPIVDPIVNGGVLGLLCSISQHQGLNVPKLVVTQILPHGVFELTAIVYASGVGLYLSEGMGRKVRAAWRARRPKRDGATAPATPRTAAAAGTGPERAEGAEPDSGLLRNVVRSFALVVVPLLFVAALIEGFITPLLR
jgi:stage II sporulation protein M